MAGEMVRFETPRDWHYFLCGCLVVFVGETVGQLVVICYLLVKGR